MKLIVTMVALMVCCMNLGFGESEIIETVCRINGQSIALGESVGKVIDSCNNCNCGNRGFACTRMACPWYQPLDCEIQGQHHNHYDVIPSDDCEECRCRNGNIVCTGCPA
ncbi:unnamed protein product [Lymnaea stagnalis]|uniref:Uncharacterized protein n=1 Tax=Lymnaea stagnalis TaxID=6523 RepID=A0AAV2IEU2_LYMST